MDITVKIECKAQFEEWARRRGITPEQLAQEIINNYCSCLHKLQYGDFEKAYEELSGEN